MGLVVKEGDLGSLCRPYRKNWGQSPNSEILWTVPKFSLAPPRGSGGGWLPGEGRRCVGSDSAPEVPPTLRPYKMLRNHV